MSVAGGVSKAVDRAVVHGCEALQIFSKNASQWKGKPLDPAEVRLFRRRIDETGISPVVAHASYLINLATTFPLLRRSEEHTSELQSQSNLVCRLLLEKKKKKKDRESQH